MKYKFLYFALILALISSNSLSAATFTWTGAGDGVSWNDQSNWNVGAGFPDDAVENTRRGRVIILPAPIKNVNRY